MRNNERETNIRVELESAPIRHIAVECPACKRWFYGHDILKKDTRYEYQLDGTECECPVCREEFSIISKVKESNYPQIYEGVLKKKEVWE